MIRLKANHTYFDVDGDNETKVPGVTTILGDAIPKPGLVEWAAKSSANEAIENWDELSTLPLGDRFTRIRTARFRNMNRSAVRGTDVHALAERLAHGESIQPPDELAPFVDSCVKFLNDWQPEVLLTETVVVNRTVGYAGTFDLVARMRGETWLLDWKTGDKVYAETALQLIAYANAEHCVVNGKEEPLPGIDRTGIVHLRADGFRVIPCRNDAEVWNTFRHVAWLARRLHQEKQGDFYVNALDEFLGEAM